MSPALAGGFLTSVPPGKSPYYLILLDCFSLFLHFLTSLIKLILWLTFSTHQRQAEDMGGKDHRVLLRFTTTEADMARYLLSCVLGAGMHSCDPGLSKQFSHLREAELALQRNREHRIHPPCSDIHHLGGAVTLVVSNGQQGPEVVT